MDARSLMLDGYETTRPRIFFCSVICFAIHGENVKPFRNPDIAFTGILWAQQLWAQQQTVTVRTVINPGLLWAEVSLVFAAHWKQEMWATTSRLPTAESSVGFGPASSPESRAQLFLLLCCLGSALGDFFFFNEWKKKNQELNFIWCQSFPGIMDPLDHGYNSLSVCGTWLRRTFLYAVLCTEITLEALSS